MAISPKHLDDSRVDVGKGYWWPVRETAPLLGLVTCTVFFGWLLKFTPVLVVLPEIGLLVVCGVTVMFCFWMLSRFAL